MKRIVPILLCLTMFFTGCSVRLSEDGEMHFSTKAAQVQNANTKSLLVMGDSIAAHYGVSDKESYEHKVSELLRRGGDEWVSDNWGVSGYTSGDLVTLLDKSLADKKAKKVLEDADLICISIGGNNILKLLKDHGFVNFPPDGGSGWATLMRAFEEGSDAIAVEYLADLEVIMKKIRSVNPTAPVLLQNIHNVARDVRGEINLFGISKHASEFIEPFYKPILNIIDQNAERLGYTVADTYGAFRDSTEEQLLRREMIHPNARGHSLIADTVYQTYLKQIKK